mgnify:CR=1 FL=1
MTTLRDTSPYLLGHHPLPAGAVPVCTDQPGSVICQTPHGHWIRWWPGTRSIESVSPQLQREIVRTVVEELGGTLQAAEKLRVSRRTIEQWRCARSVLPCKAAIDIASLLRG